MRKLPLFILILQASVALCGVKDSVNQVDSEGRKQGYWIIKNDVKKLPNYSMEAKVEEGSFTDSKKIGIWKTYFPNGNLKNEITYDNNRQFGYAKAYYESGELQEEGQWENMRWVGSYKTYYKNGKTEYDFKYNSNGKRDGEQYYGYENGEMMMQGLMQDGKETGVWKEQYENGEPRAEKAYNNGTLDADNTKVFAIRTPILEKPDTGPKGPPKIADPNTEAQNPAQERNGPWIGDGQAKLFIKGGRVSKDGFFKKYQLIDGKDFVYNTDGILERIDVYKAGKKIGTAPIEEKDK